MVYLATYPPARSWFRWLRSAQPDECRVRRKFVGLPSRTCCRCCCLKDSERCLRGYLRRENDAGRCWECHSKPGSDQRHSRLVLRPKACRCRFVELPYYRVCTLRTEDPEQ